MAFGLAEGTFRTLRFRLTFWNTALLLLIVSVTLVGLRQALLWTMLGELDHLLSEDSLEVALIVRGHHPRHDLILEALERKASSHREDGWFVQVFHPDGRLYVATQSTRPVEGALPSVILPTGSTLNGRRLVHRTLDEPPFPSLIIRVGASLQNIEEDVGRLTRLLLATGFFIMAVAPLAGYFLAGRATRPLAAILKTARRLRPDHLGERLTLRGTGDELDRLSETINSFLDSLGRHLKQQREFVANAAHELRSPLTALRTSIEIALERERTPQQYQELLADLAEECTALGTLINQLLLLAESEAGRFQPGESTADLAELVRRSAEMFHGVAEHGGITLNVDAPEPIQVAGQPTHLRQVLHNLIDNAIKFTPQGGRVDIELRRRPAENGHGEWADLWIRDTGIGISHEDLPHVFDRFFRADRARQRSQGGSGLGLCICQSIVRALGGDIQITSALSRGTCVHVCLPASPGK